MSNFSTFAQAVRAKFEQMIKQDLFIIDTDKDTLFGLYLASFPEEPTPSTWHVLNTIAIAVSSSFATSVT